MPDESHEVMQFTHLFLVQGTRAPTTASTGASCCGPVARREFERARQAAACQRVVHTEARTPCRKLALGLGESVSNVTRLTTKSSATCSDQPTGGGCRRSGPALAPSRRLRRPRGSAARGRREPQCRVANPALGLGPMDHELGIAAEPLVGADRPLGHLQWAGGGRRGDPRQCFKCAWMIQDRSIQLASLPGTSGMR